MIQRPEIAHCDLERKTVLLQFPNADHDEWTEFHMRGGICWPTFVEPDIESIEKHFVGVAIVAGQDVKSKHITVFEQREFVTVENIINPGTRVVEYVGLSQWLNEMWARYYCDKFYIKQEYETFQNYRLDLIRSAILKHHVQCIEVPWNDADIFNLTAKAIKMKIVRIAKDSILASQFQQASPDDKRVRPALHALQCLLSGINRFPWREPRG